MHLLMSRSDKESATSQMIPPTSLYGKRFMRFIQKKINQSEEEVGLVTPINVKDTESSQMTPPTSLYDKRFMRYRPKKDRPIREEVMI